MNLLNLVETDDYNKQPFPQMIKNNQNMQTIVLYEFSKFFLLEPNFKITRISSKLLIEKSTGKIRELDFNDKSAFQNEKLKSRRIFTAFMGIIKILNHYFLLMIEEAQQVCVLENHNIYQISSVNFVSLENEAEIKKKQKWKDMTRFFEIMKKLLMFGFYFSFTYDLSMSKEKQAHRVNGPENSYWWNQYLMGHLLTQKIDKKWQLVVIQGFAKSFSVYIMGKKLEFFLISRKSCRRAGTRYNARGVDDEGNVANFVETEQIIYYSYYCCSLVLIRGSVPLFWEQKGVTSNLKLSRNLDLTNAAFVKHFENLEKNYKRVLCINLMHKSKSEQVLTEAFESLIQKNNLENTRYEFFDFHAACKGQKFENLEILTSKLGDVIENFKFFAEQNKRDQRILMEQEGTVRINCLDCLDRTNLVMMKMAAIGFENMMKHMNTNLTLALGDSLLKMIDTPLSSSKRSHPFIYNFKNAWADNGDFISIHYAGTGSTTSNVTRTGKGGFMNMLDHGMKSIERFYVNNFEDHLKQEGIDLLLGQDNGEFYWSQFDQFTKELENQTHEFVTFSPLSVFILSWNIGGFKPSNLDLVDLNFLNFENYGNPDIVVIGFQEVVNLNMKNMMSTNNDKLVSLWESIITTNLNKIDKYFVVASQNLIGCLLVVFVKENVKDRIKKVDTDLISLGLAGKLGNKGAVLIKLEIDDTAICFTNCHLQAGSKNFEDRVNNIAEIHMKAFKKNDEKIQNFDYKFFFGDFNFRVNKPNSEVREKLKKYENLMQNQDEKAAERILHELQFSDEIFLTRKLSEYLDKYQEAPITFMPTYKYDVFSNNYDTSKKQRGPSWCDRIMIWPNEDCIVKQYFYNRKESKLSDHRPVCAYYSLEIKKVNTQKKDEIIHLITDYIKKEEINKENKESVCK